jgi:hypothetical protein
MQHQIDIFLTTKLAAPIVEFTSKIVHVQGQPEFTGGTLTDRLYLPEPWLEAGEIRLVIQALGPAAQLDRVGLVTTTKHE